jgi:hypothetical protein
LNELKSLVPDHGYALEIRWTDNTERGANIRVDFDDDVSSKCRRLLVEKNIVFSTDKDSLKFWILVARTSSDLLADSNFEINRAGINDRCGVSRNDADTYYVPFIFLLEAVVWIFCFGTDLAFKTITIPIFSEQNPTSFRKAPRCILNAPRQSKRDTYDFSAYKSKYNISHNPRQW